MSNRRICSDLYHPGSDLATLSVLYQIVSEADTRAAINGQHVRQPSKHLLLFLRHQKSNIVSWILKTNLQYYRDLAIKIDWAASLLTDPLTDLPYRYFP